MKIEINKGKFNLREALVKDAIRKTFKKLSEIGKIKKEVEKEISVAIVDREKIKEINKRWRDKNEETDVLSFCYESTDERLEGEVVVCLEIVEENAKKDGVITEKELVKNIVHSILHISGYEHGVEMFELQEVICRE
jgi:probable rRNA maturation factor